MSDDGWNHTGLFVQYNRKDVDVQDRYSTVWVGTVGTSREQRQQPYVQYHTIGTGVPVLVHTVPSIVNAPQEEGDCPAHRAPPARCLHIISHCAKTKMLPGRIFVSRRISTSFHEKQTRLPVWRGNQASVHRPSKFSSSQSCESKNQSI